MPDSVEREIRELRSLFWSDRDPGGRGFAPLADAYRRAGDFDQALELLNDGLDRHPSFSTGHVVAGWVHRDRGAALEAEAAFRTALRLDEENVEALRGLGFLLVDRDRADDALSFFARAADLAPDDEEVRAVLDRMDESPAPAPDPEQAATEEVVTAAGVESLVEEPENGWTAPPDRDALGLGEATAEEGGDDDIAAPGEEEGPATRTMAELYVRQGMPDRAARVYARLLEAEPGNPELEARLEELRAGADRAPDEEVAAERPRAGRSYESDVEALAEDMSRAPAPTFESPFAWSEATAEGEAPPPADERPVSDYFATLLTWTPGTESREREADVLDIDRLAPDAETPSELDGLPEGDATIVPVEALAPEDPGASGEADPGGREAGGEDDEEDDFTRWLDQLR